MKDFKIALQLYSVRDHMEKDMDATLKAVKEMGYDYVEFAGYFDKTGEEIKALLDKHKLICSGVHRNVDLILNDPEVEIGILKTIGAKYSAIPWYDVSEYVDNWDETIEKFKKLGKLLKENDIDFLYHNHEFEFTKIGDEYLIDKLYREVPELNPQFDTCWVRYGGEDPSEYLKKYNGRVSIVHLKDFVCDKIGGGPVYELIGQVSTSQQRADNNFKFRAVGYGMQNWEEILKACEDVDATVLVVEQDQSYDDDSLNQVKLSREYLKKEFNL